MQRAFCQFLSKSVQCSHCIAHYPSVSSPMHIYFCCFSVLFNFTSGNKPNSLMMGFIFFLLSNKVWISSLWLYFYLKSFRFWYLSNLMTNYKLLCNGRLIRDGLGWSIEIDDLSNKKVKYIQIVCVSEKKETIIMFFLDYSKLFPFLINFGSLRIN